MKDLQEFEKKLRTLSGWMSNHKAISAVFLAAIMTGSVVGVVAWTHNQQVVVSTGTATIGVEQTIYFNGTNANQNPIVYGTQDFNTSTSLYTQIGPTLQTGGIGNATTSLSFGGFEPGDYIQMTVNITNTGSSVLLLNNSAVNVPIFASIRLQNGSYLINDSATFGLGVLFTPPVNTPSIIEGYLSSSQSSGLLDNYGQYLPDNELWIAGFSTVNDSKIPTYLAPHQTFAYELWVGLGTNASELYGSTSYLSLSIPLMPAQ